MHKLLISAFIVLNLLTVLYVNRPECLVQVQDRAVTSCPSPVSAVIHRWDFLDRDYGHATGLDANWKMFATLPRNDWQDVIKAQYDDSTTLVLPLPLQSERTPWQRYVADHKEVKLDLNLLADHSVREAYCNYLARQYPDHKGAPVRTIVWEYHLQPVLPPAEALQRGSHLAPELDVVILETFHYP